MVAVENRITEFRLRLAPPQAGGDVTDQNISPVPGKSPTPSLSEEQVDRTRAWTGLFVIVGGDVAIAVAAIVALVKFAGSANANSAVIASVLSSAFAAIGTMTTAYFGIRESGTTAQRSVKHQTGTPTS
jgi:Na+/melibiose symporter-like transporter